MNEITINGKVIFTGGKEGSAVIREALSACGYSDIDEMLAAKESGAVIPAELLDLIAVVANGRPYEDMKQLAAMRANASTKTYFGAERHVTEDGVVEYQGHQR